MISAILSSTAYGFFDGSGGLGTVGFAGGAAGFGAPDGFADGGAAGGRVFVAGGLPGAFGLGAPVAGPGAPVVAGDFGSGLFSNSASTRTITSSVMSMAGFANTILSVSPPRSSTMANPLSIAYLSMTL